MCIFTNDSSNIDSMNVYKQIKAQDSLNFDTNSQKFIFQKCFSWLFID